MASTLDPKAARQPVTRDDDAVAIIDAAELEAARNDPRVWSFLEEADAYLAELERQGRNH